MSEPRILEIERRLNSIAAEMRAAGRRTAALEQRGLATTGAGGASSYFGSSSPLIYIQAPGGGIPARSGGVLGSAVCKVFARIDAAGNTADTGLSVTVYNVSTTAVGANKYGVAGAEGDAWVVLVESCT